MLFPLKNRVKHAVNYFTSKYNKQPHTAFNKTSIINYGYNKSTQKYERNNNYKNNINYGQKQKVNTRKIFQYLCEYFVMFVRSSSGSTTKYTKSRTKRIYNEYRGKFTVL